MCTRRKRIRKSVKFLAFGLLASSATAYAASGDLGGGFNISGYVAPTYIYSQDQNISSFYLGTTAPGPYEYYSTNLGAIGGVQLNVSKTFKDGSGIYLSFMPNMGYNKPIQKAQFKVPLSDHWTLTGGQVIAWDGYESSYAPTLLTITQSLAYDYIEPGYYTGLGAEYAAGPYSAKFMVGNFNTAFNASSKTPSFQYYLGYSPSSSPWSFWLYGAVADTNTTPAPGPTYNLIYNDLDGQYASGPITLGWELFLENASGGAVNGGTGQAWGTELLGNYKLTDAASVTLRYDYFNDTKNGGLASVTGSPGAYNYQGGFAPNPNDPNRGPVRQELTVAGLYQFTPELLGKIEYRYDWSDHKTFGLYQNAADAAGGSLYGLSNHSSLVGVQMVYSF